VAGAAFMIEALQFIVRYQLQILAGLGALTLVYLILLSSARARLDRTPFGLEREAALRRQNRAVAVLGILVSLALLVYLSERLILPAIIGPPVTATPPATPTITPSPVAADHVVVDSSGCDNPNVTLTAPANHEVIAGSYEVQGTADIPNFAFYKIEISGAGTGSEWLSLDVGTEPVVEGALGSFDANARESGAYAFRLVVLDNAGNSPPPCVVAVTLVGATNP
jgi:hypothetical protein